MHCSRLIFGLACLVVLDVFLATTLSAQENASPPATDLYGDPLPAGAVARLGTLRYRHESIFGLKPFALLSDETLMITSEHAVALWDLPTGVMEKEFDFRPLNIRGAALSSDGKWIAVSGFSTKDLKAPSIVEVRIVDTASGATLRSLKRDTREEGAMVAFSSDGKLLFSAASSGVFRVEEVGTGVELLTHQFPSDVNPSFTLSLDGQKIAYASGANTNKVFLWDWRSGEEPLEMELPGAERDPHKLAFSPDGKLLLIADDHRRPPEIWDVQSKQIVVRLLLPKGETISPYTASFTPDGKSVVLAGSKPPRNATAHVWDAATGQHRLTIDGLSRHAVSPDSKRLIGVNPMGVWSLETGKRILPTEDNGHAGGLNTVAFLQNGEVLTAGRDDETIRIWDPKTMRQKLKLPGHRWLAAAGSPDGRWIVSAGHDNRVRLWDAETGRKVFDLPGHGRLGGRYTVAFDSQSRTFLTYGDNFRIRMWDVSTGKALADSKIAPSGVDIPADENDRDLMPHLSFTQSCFSPDGKVLYVSFRKRIHRLDSGTGEELSSFEVPFSSINTLRFSDDGNILLIGGISNPQQIALPNGQVRFATGTDRMVLLVIAETGEEIQKILTPGGYPGISALSADGKLIADASPTESRNKLAIYDAETGHLKHSVDLPSQPWVVTFSPDNQTIATGHTNGNVLLWDLSKLPTSTGK